jgi:hypothetical protein
VQRHGAEPCTSLAGVRGPSHPVPAPLEGNDQLITAVITAGWAVALILLLVLRGHLAASDHWWIWTAAAGLGIGLFGLAYVPRLKRSRARAAQRRGQPDPAAS